MTIALIVSSAGFILFVGEEVEGPLEILNNEWNLPIDERGVYQLPFTKEGRYTYSLGISIQKSIGRLEIFFATLENSSFKASLGDMSTASPRERLGWLEGLGDTVSFIESYPESSIMIMRIDEVEILLKTPDAEQKGLLLDLSNIVRPVTTGEIMHQIPNVHAVFFDADGNISQYYRGFPDFFLDREEKIIDLTIQHNENVTRFSSRTTQQGKSLGLNEAPTGGRLIFPHPGKEDQIFITLAINPADPEALILSRSKPAVMHLVLIFIDGEYYQCFTNLMMR